MLISIVISFLLIPTLRFCCFTNQYLILLTRLLLLLLWVMVF